MKVSGEGCKLLFTKSLLLLISGLGVHSLPYDYSATTECVTETPRAQYGGGILVNPGFDHDIDGWTVFGNGAIEERVSNGGNRFIVARNRTRPLDSFSQKVQLEKGIIYSFSAWFQVSEGSETVSVVFKTNASDELIYGGHVNAKHGCWSLLKGGIVANYSTPAEILFESENPTVEIWVDSVSLQPFTKKQWRLHQDESIERVRKSKVRFQISHTNKTALEGATIFINQTESAFPFGCGINYHILTSIGYQQWFVSRFKYTTFTNAMKWYSTEEKQGHENYTIADAMLKFTKENGISVRGHNIFWDNQKMQPHWVNTLSPEELCEAAEKRINSVVSRYKGELIAWDVVNENLHFSFYEDNLGENASAEYFSKAFQLDPKPLLFMNEYNTIEYSKDKKAMPSNYIKKLKKIMSFPGNEKISAAIGLQGHFSPGQPNIPYMRAGLDAFGTTGLPIWITEASVDSDPNQGAAGVIDQYQAAEHLEEILREAYSHPSVQGIIMFTGPAAAGFKDTLLAYENFTNTPSGDVVDKLIKEWKSGPQKATADSRGFVEFSLHHGDYEITVTHPLSRSSKTLNLSVRKDSSQQPIHVQMHTTNAIKHM